MKANYTKPLLGVELFSLAQSVTRDCDTSIPFNLNDPNCYWDLGNGTSVFLQNTNCMLDGESMDYGCYNNPGEGQYIFRS